MTSNLHIHGDSPTELRRRRTFRLRLFTATGLYILSSIALSLWGRQDTPWRALWAILPLVFVVLVVVVVVLRVRQLDEYQLKLLFPGLAAGFTVTIFAAITVGTLSDAGLSVPNLGWSVALVGLIVWAFTTIITGSPKA